MEAWHRLVKQQELQGCVWGSKSLMWVCMGVALICLCTTTNSGVAVEEEGGRSRQGTFGYSLFFMLGIFNVDDNHRKIGDQRSRSRNLGGSNLWWNIMIKKRWGKSGCPKAEREQRKSKRFQWWSGALKGTIRLEGRSRTNRGEGVEV
ncbi:hypothetical protein AMTR_s00007p00266040 [Amborella trichopoda]|uniref:Uncharacterized protein n=1 Tax=Amborella trichopoda TaxID=13333 RepID=W1PD54_AMBTC|nr:hypothetical protein AMTR_s00007p00266040 [Amborella trichopoda]